MFGKRIRLFKIFGFEVGTDWSWIILAILLLRKALEGEPVKRFMKNDPVTVTPSLSVAQLVEDYIYNYHYKMFPIVEDTDRLVGCVTTKQVKDVPPEEWGHKKVGEIATQCSAEHTIGSQIDAMRALSITSKTGTSRLMVTEKNRLLGIIALKDLLKFFALKVELEEQ